MKKIKFSLAVVSLMLILIMMLNFVGCSMNSRSTNLMENVKANNVSARTDLGNDSEQITDFAIRLFKATNENGSNTAISPLSVLYALAMTANGAEGETREQMEAVFGMSVEELNLYLYSYLNSLPQGEKYKLKLANSIWVKDEKQFNVNEDFLQTNADYYGADIYKASFDNGTLDDINSWVNKETDGMIPEVLDKISEDAVMYLINALAFEAEWTEIYEEKKVRDKVFTKEDGTKQDVKLMYSTENKYINDDKATGFIKYYKGGKYAFVALLPNDGVTVSEYVNSLTGESMVAMLANAENKTVLTEIPKFETEYEIEMSEVLKAMGMTSAFDEISADFNGIGVGAYEDSNLYINSVIHKTYIQIAEQGTKAGASTVVEMDEYGAEWNPETLTRVYLDRPFAYMLIDCENNVPFFIGTVMDVS